MAPTDMAFSGFIASRRARAWIALVCIGLMLIAVNIIAGRFLTARLDLTGERQQPGQEHQAHQDADDVQADRVRRLEPEAHPAGRKAGVCGQLERIIGCLR